MDVSVFGGLVISAVALDLLASWKKKPLFVLFPLLATVLSAYTYVGLGQTGSLTELVGSVPASTPIISATIDPFGWTAIILIPVFVGIVSLAFFFNKVRKKF